MQGGVISMLMADRCWLTIWHGDWPDDAMPGLMPKTNALETASALNNGVAPMQTSPAQPDSDASALSQSMVDASMPQAAPPPLPPLPKDFPDNPTASAMFLWAEDHELSVLDAQQAVLHLHQHNAQELAQHASGSHVSLPEGSNGFRAVAMGTGCHSDLVVA